MRYEFVKAEKAIYPVSVLCHVLRVSRSGFYAWVQRGESKRSRENRSLLKEIQAAHRVSRSNYGSPRITRELRAGGTRVGEKRVARIMRQNGIVGKVRRRYRVTTQAGDRAPEPKSLLNRDFKASEPNRKWVSDITYIPTREGWLYLAVIIDLYSRAVVGWSMNSWISQELVLDALKMAVGPTTSPEGSDAALGSRPTIHQLGVSASSQRSPDGVLDEPQGQLLGQCGGRELLCHPQERIGGL